MPTIWIEMPIATGWPSKADVTLRNNVTTLVDAAGIGKCTGAGGGMGKMDLSYLVEDEWAARKTIEAVMRQFMPDAIFTVRVTP